MQLPFPYMKPKFSHFYKLFKTCTIHPQTHYSHIISSKLVYKEFGDPIKVIQLQEEKLNKPQPNQVLIKMLASPVNPADINTIQGKYPSKPTLPATSGNEGVGEIIELGSNVMDFNVGDHIVPLVELIGTWRTHVLIDQKSLLKVPQELGVINASTLTVNPCTAYRMLKDFVTLEKGDVLIQNGANSSCGQNVIQLAKYWGYSTINIVRNRPNITELKEYLKNMGATEVLTEEEFKKTDLFRAKIYAKPKLVLNCVGGKNSLELIRYMDNAGVVVTYGGMSLQPLMVPASALIFKDVKVRGFWVTAWAKKPVNKLRRLMMFNELIELMCKGVVKPPVSKMVQFPEYKEALNNTLTEKGMVGMKYILRM